jgi:acetolactate synthase-1/2/3 large subunit
MTAPQAPRPAATSTETLTGAQALVRSLENVGAEVVFGIPGGAILPAYDPLFDSVKLRHILVRHEQGGGHAAEGYAQATGRVGVCMATSGPGATNLVTPIADAYMDSVPLVAITGQVPSANIGTDAVPGGRHRRHHDADHQAQLPRAVGRRHPAHDRRGVPPGQHRPPGPVLVDLPKDVLQAQGTFSWPPVLDLPGYHPTTRPHAKQVREAARSSPSAKRPVLYVGGGVLKARAAPSCGCSPSSPASRSSRRSWPAARSPTATRSTSACRHARHGRRRHRAAEERPARLPRRPLRRPRHRQARQLRAGRGRHPRRHRPGRDRQEPPADVPIVGDCRETIADLVVAVQEVYAAGTRADLTGWWKQLDGWRDDLPARLRGARRRLARPAARDRAHRPDRRARGDLRQRRRAAPDVRQPVHHVREPLHLAQLRRRGTMGYAVPAAMGAKVGRPEATVWAIDGDGCFQMTNQELVTCAVEGIPIKVAVINNGNLGMVRQWQTLFYEGRYSNTRLQSQRIPDFVKLAEAMGCVGLRCEKAEDVDATIDKAMAVDDLPVVVDFVVGEDAMVWPMVPAGTSNDEILAARDTRPVWDADDV